MNAKDMPVSESSKKDYTPPQIVFKQKLEAMAVACLTANAKASTGLPGNCDPAQLFS